MGNYEQLKQAVSDVIKANGNQEITGAILQNALLSIISTIGKNATFAGIATPTTNPGTPDGPVFYLASKTGTYSNFDGIVIENEAAILLYNGSAWVKEATGIALTESVLNLVAKSTIIDPQTLNSYNKIDPDKLILGKGIVPTTGKEGDYPNRACSNYIDVQGINKVYSQVYGNGQIYAYDKDFNFISGVSAVTAEMSYTFPKNTRYIRISVNQAMIGGNSLFLYIEEEKTYYEYGITKDKIYTDSKIEEVNTELEKISSLDDAVQTSNQYINKLNYGTDWIYGFILVNGKETSYANGCITKFINVLGVEKVYSNVYSNGGIAGYNENKEYVKIILPSPAGVYAIDGGIRYIRFFYKNKNNNDIIFLYTNEEHVNLSNVSGSTFYEYGITYTDVKQQPEIDVIPTKIDRFDIRYHNFINIFSENIIAKKGAFLNTSDGYSEITTISTQSYSHFIPVVAGKILCSNISSYGRILKYDKEKQYLGVVSGWKSDARFKNNIRYVVLDDDVAFLRFSAPQANYNEYFISVSDVYAPRYFDYGETFNIHFKYSGKKLVTIGDSITYQRTWQDRLCELTGLWHNPKEVKGADEGVKTEGYGYILLTSGNEDTDTYYEEVEGISKSDETVVDGFGYAHPIWTDSEGNKYRQPCRTAEGGETVMPVNTTSIYSRASDSKYYKGDVVIVFAGANDKVTYINKYPTYGDLSNIQGLTNLKDGTEDTTEATFEIYTEDAVLTAEGDYSDVEEVTGIKKYNHTFRACFRGLLKKVVDANPNAQIIVIGPFATMIKAYDYISRGYDYLTIEENKVIEECAREFGCQYINLYPLFGRYGADKYFRGTDGTVYIHPTDKGGREIAEYIASMIQ